MEYYCILSLLSICGWSDFRKQQIPCIVLWIGAVSICLLSVVQILKGDKVWWDSLGGAAVGGILVLISLISHQQIGIGDGILFIITGIGLGFMNNICLLMGSLCLTSTVSIILLVIKKIGRKTTLPFVPFVWISFIIETVLEHFH